MKNFKLTIQYDGTCYCGWQTQAITKRKCRQKPSIQQTIEGCLEKIVRQKVGVIASGRTDSGVHAIGQVANFKSTTVLTPHKIQSGLNGVLPSDIRVSKVQSVSFDFHARYSVVTKVYRYFIQPQAMRPSPFFKDYSYWFKFPLDQRLMKAASQFLLGKHDFKSFCASGSNSRSTVRTIRKLSISRVSIFSCSMICIEIEADGFLYNMVRNIVGTLLEVGRGRLEPRLIKRILHGKKRSLAGPCVPAKGLFLVRVKY